MKRNACQKCVFAVNGDKPHCGLRGFRNDFNVEYCSAENDTIPNGYELQEDGYFSWVEKKKEYPKTYEECCKVLNVFRIFVYDEELWIPQSPEFERELDIKLAKLRQLLICRDAYWKIAGEKMDLGNPWEPDWEDVKSRKYAIVAGERGKIIKGDTTSYACTFAFPTEEMRDAFYENFKSEIEICKELL